jgi:phage terminase large subunit-like protein
METPMSSSGVMNLRAELQALVRAGNSDRYAAEAPADTVARLVRDWEVLGRFDQLPHHVLHRMLTEPAIPDRPPDDDEDEDFTPLQPLPPVDPVMLAGLKLDWRTWLVLGGRGSGKTRAGAEWVRTMALGIAPFTNGPVLRIALIGETIADVRTIMVEGVSGVLSVHAPHERPVYEPSKRQLTWPNGAVAQLFSAEDPDGLRGPQFGAAWCDELAKWRYADKTWDMLQFALRLGASPRQVVTTTPRPIGLLKRILGDAATAVSRSRTLDNFSNLAPGFVAEMRARYGATALGRQELDGELVEDREDGLWSRAQLERTRVDRAPELVRIVVAVDPPVTSGAKADACGIVVAGIDAEGRGYVLSDRTVAGYAPLVWAKVAVAALEEFQADRIVAEVNQGGDLVEGVIRQIDASVPLRKVRATRGKFIRAEPVAALYERGLVSHVGQFAALEDQLCDFGPAGLSTGRSPDRLDALVWALTDLMLGSGGEPKIRSM